MSFPRNSTRGEILALLALALGAASSASAQSAEPSRTLAIHPLQPLGTDPAIVGRLEQLVHVEVGALGTVILVDQAEVTRAVALRSQLGAPCEGAPKCLAELGRKLGADQILFGTVATLGGAYVLDLKLVDSLSGKVAGRSSATLQGEQAVLIQGVRELVVQLVAPAQFVGTLDVRVAQEGAEVLVDGVAVGTSPLRPIAGVAPGKHALRVTRADKPDHERFVDVVFGRTTVVQVDLDRRQSDAEVASASGQVTESEGPAGEPRPGFPMLPVGIGVVAVGAAALGGGAISAAQLLAPWLEAGSNTEESSNGMTVVTDREDYQRSVDRYRDAEGYWWLGVGLGAAGAALVAAGAGLIAWDMSAPPEEEQAGE